MLNTMPDAPDQALGKPSTASSAEHGAPLLPQYGHFRKEIETIINTHSLENGSDTPDYILAQYLLSCLLAFDEAVKCREVWHGRKTLPTSEDIQKFY